MFEQTWKFAPPSIFQRFSGSVPEQVDSHVVPVSTVNVNQPSSFLKRSWKTIASVISYIITHPLQAITAGLAAQSVAVMAFDKTKTIELSTLDGHNGFKIIGASPGDKMGSVVGVAGDVNGDGITDLMVASSSAYDNAGATYIIFGRDRKRAWDPLLYLSSFNKQYGFEFIGDTSNYNGYSVAAAGDVNGDEVDDVIIGAVGTDSLTGASYVIFGNKSGLQTPIYPKSLVGTNGFKLAGVQREDQSGYSVGAAGDMNGDGIDDVIIGAMPREAVYVVFGRNKTQVWDPLFELSKLELDGKDGFKITGREGDQSGCSVGAGDINGDGYKDIIIGSPNAYASSGAAYVIFSQKSDPKWNSSFSLSNLNGSNGFELRGGSQDREIGIVVGTVGDINGDTIDDFVISMRSTGDESIGKASGAVYVVFGNQNSWNSSFDLSKLDGKNGFKLIGSPANRQKGNPIGGGDINGDGINDLIVGSFMEGYEIGKPEAGATYVIFGHHHTWEKEFFLSQITGTNGFKLMGEFAGDWSGCSVGAGDINGDGIKDIIIGSYNNSGAAYIVFGSTPTPSPIPLNADTNHTLRDALIGTGAGIGLIGFALFARHYYKKSHQTPILFKEPLIPMILMDSYNIDYSELEKQPVPPLGKGGFGVVYMAMRHGGPVAVKELRAQHLSVESIQAFKEETEVMAGLHAHNIVQFYGYCLSPYCLVMEYMPRGSLYDVLRAEPGLDWAIRWKIAADMACGLDFLHKSKHKSGKGIIHGDIKSPNVLLTSDYTAKLSDFGLSTLRKDVEKKCATSELRGGTLTWMAPELLSDKKSSPTQQSDIYSLGITFWELASAQDPFGKVSDHAPAELSRRIIEGERPPIIPSDCPSKLGTLIKACWSADAQSRPSAEQILAFLRSQQDDFKVFLPSYQRPQPVQENTHFFDDVASTSLPISDYRGNQDSQPHSTQFAKI